MQNVANATAATNAFTPSGAQKAKETTGTNDFETFLTLLTAQMRNQDPLKPMESTEFVAQLASFSSVEQQIRTNDQLAELINAFSASPATGLAEWIGKEVRHFGATQFNSTPIKVNVAADPTADTAYLRVKDVDGQTVYRQQFDPEDQVFTWNGALDASGTAPAGRYSFEVESFQNNALIKTSPASVFDLVTEVRIDNNKMTLVFPDGTTMLADDTTSLRLPLE